MKAYVLFLLASVTAASAFAQVAPRAMPQPGGGAIPGTSPLLSPPAKGASAPGAAYAGAVPGPASGAVMPVPRAVVPASLPPGRNPMMPPIAQQASVWTPGVGSAQAGRTTSEGPALGARPGTVPGPVGMPPAFAGDVDPIKAAGKRIGRVNGKAIFKHEDGYYFDPKAEKPKK